MTPPRTTQQLAEEIGVSERSLQRRKQIAKIEPEVQEAIARTEVANSTTQLLELARLKPEAQRQAVGIMQKTGKWDAKSAITEINRSVRIQKINEIAKGNRSLEEVASDPDRAVLYPVIYADPPWKYEDVQSESRAIEYPTMALDDICALPVSDLATPDAVLFLWTTSPKIAESMEVITAWGFVHRTCAVWTKDKIGMGYYFRQQHELLLVCTRGSIPVPPVEARVSSVIHAPRTGHSEKPAIFAEIIEKMYPELPKLELFCRSPRPGWSVWGNQAGGVAA